MCSILGLLALNVHAAPEVPPYWWSLDVNARKQVILDDDPYEGFTYFEKSSRMDGLAVPLRIVFLRSSANDGAWTLSNGLAEPVLMDSRPMRVVNEVQEQLAGVDGEGMSITRKVDVQRNVGCRILWFKGLVTGQKARFDVNDEIHPCADFNSLEVLRRQKIHGIPSTPLEIDHHVAWAQLSRPVLQDGSHLQNSWRAALFADASGLWQHVCEPFPIGLELIRADGSRAWDKVYVNMNSRPRVVCDSAIEGRNQPLYSRVGPSEVGIPNPSYPDLLLSDQRTLLIVRTHAIYRIRLDTGELLGSPPGLVVLDYDWLSDMKRKIWNESVDAPWSARVVKLYLHVERKINAEAMRK
jgi:hypothetical protein